MPDHLTKEQRSKAMGRVKTKDGPLEVAVRSALWRRGFRFRKHVKKLPGSPDVVFPREKVAVFIDGDFWHGYNFEKWEHKLKEFWRDKIRENIARDERNFRALTDDNWLVLRVWQHEIKTDLNDVVARIENSVLQRRLPNDSRTEALQGPAVAGEGATGGTGGAAK